MRAQAVRLADDFLRRWSGAEPKKAIIHELTVQGVMWEALAGEVEKEAGQAAGSTRSDLPRRLRPTRAVAPSA